MSDILAAQRNTFRRAIRLALLLTLWLQASATFAPLGRAATGSLLASSLPESHSLASSFVYSNFRSVMRYLEAAPPNFGACNTAGPIEVEATSGANGPAAYATLKAAFDAINSGIHTGTINVEVCGDTTETVSAQLNASGSGSASYNSIAIAPVGAVRTISGDSAATIDLNGADNVTIDGRLGGAGASKDLTIENTSPTGATIRLISGADSNILKYLTLRGAATGTAVGVVTFSAGANNNNTIDHSDIRDGAATPTNGVYSGGGFAGSGNAVSNCNIFNFYDSTGNDASGVRIDSGSGTDWTITGNSFYQTAGRAVTTSTVRGIYVNAGATGNNFTVTNNSIGGSAPSAGSTAWTTTGTSLANRFAGIQLNVGTATESSVQGNTVKNIVWTSSSNATTLPGVWSGIYVQAGAANIGAPAMAARNTIGNSTGNDSVSVTTSGSGGTTFGIGAAGSATRVISSNSIGSITTNGSTTSDSASLVGIQVTAGTNTISNNTVGSTSDAHSLNAVTSSTAGTAQQVTGILSSSSGGTTITNNTVANLNNNYAGTSTTGQIRGVVTAGGANTIISNTIRNLSTSSGNAATGAGASVVGISQALTATPSIISQNAVHSLSSTRSSSTISVVGIFNRGVAVVSRNFVHSFKAISSDAATTLVGIGTNIDNNLYANNIVRLGIDSTGASVSGNYAIRGIEETNSANNYYHNSVFLGGSGIASSSSATHALFSTGLAPRVFQNNIFVNARSNSSGSAKHYAVRFAGILSSTGGLTSDHNIFFVSGPGGVLGFFDNADRTTIQNWRSATGQDLSSAFADPLFADPSAATPNLHLQASNPAEASGAPIASVTDDFDGETRASLTPADIGADAGNFALSSDVFLPVISYTLLTDDPSPNRALTGFATITDNVGVSGGASSPRLYFKKTTDADVFGGNTSADNGWKFVSASNSTSPYSFTIDESIIYGGNITNGNSIQYFVVAQDAANNLSSNPVGAGFSGNPPVQNVNAKPGTVNSYNVAGSISGTRTVCASGCDYSSLTRADGVFAAINNFSTLDGDLVISISGDLTEDGTNALNQWTESGVGNYTLTIKPSDGTMKTISGSAPGLGLIRLNGADRVTIDGRFNNAGRFLTFRNTNAAVGVTISFRNDASGNTVRSSIIEGAAAALGIGVVLFDSGAGNGNNNNTVTDNIIRDRSDAAGVPVSLIASASSTAGGNNTGNTISNNELFNFTTTGVRMRSGNESWTISGNTIYQTATRTSALVGIEFDSDGTNTITQNTVRDLMNTSGSATGILLRPATGTTTVSRNRLYSFPSSPGSTGFLVGINNSARGASVTLVNNQIIIIPSFTSDQAIIGIFDSSFGGGNVEAHFNSVLIDGTASGTNSTWACLRSSSSPHLWRNNIFFNNRTGASGNHFAVGNHSTSGTFTSNNNLFVGTGATAAAFMDFGTDNAGTPVSFATWQSSTGGDANSPAGNPGGNFTSAMFANPALGDLHIVPAGNPLVSNTGTPVTGFTTDYDDETRSATTPDIGSDEFVVSAAPEINVKGGSPLVNILDGDITPDATDHTDFGNVTVGGYVGRTFTIENTGTADLNLSSAPNYVTISGAADFTVTIQPTSPVSCGGSTTFTIQFTPGSAGVTSTASVSIINDDSNENPYNFDIKGTALVTNAVNHPPLFTKGPDQTVSEDSGPQSVPGWATAIASGPVDESGQTVTFLVQNNTNPALFSAGPAISATGTLSYTPAANANGTATITIALMDDGGGADTSPSQTFVIHVNQVNDPPSFTKGPDQTMAENPGPQSVPGWATAISPGPTDESGQTVTFLVQNNTNSALFSSGPAISSTGTLSYTPAANANGSAMITIALMDNGSGADTSPSQTFAIKISQVNDAPSFTRGSDQTVPEDSGPQNVPGWATAIASGPADESGQTMTFLVQNNTNPALFSAGPAISATGTLSYTPAANANGSATITIALMDDGGGADTSPSQTFAININQVNDPPSFTKGLDQTVAENPGPQSVSGWATAISPGPTDESGQALSFLVQNNTNSALFSSGPAISSTGTLSYTPTANANGSAMITIALMDNGGGADTSPSQTFAINISQVNEAPSFNRGSDQTVAEDSGPQNVPGWATAIASGPADESGQTMTFLVQNNTNPALFSAGPAISATGTLSYTPAANANGSATITIALMDNGGGTNTSPSQTFVIHVNQVNDAPSFTKGANQTVNEDAGAQTIPSWATGISSGPANESDQIVSFATTNNNNALFSAQPAISPNGTLTYTSAPDVNGTATVSVTLKDNGGITDGGQDSAPVQTFTVIVNAVNDAPDLVIAKSHQGNFFAGQTGASYAIQVSNVSTGQTSELVTVTDNVPVGLTPTGPNGLVGGWFCSINAQTVTCTRSDALPGGGSYPAINLTVNVANPAPLNATNTATVAGGGEVNTGNNTASDPTTIDCSANFALNNQSPLVISRFRENGPAGPQDEFVEIFNPSPTPHTVASGNCGGGGYGVYASAGNGTTSNTATLVCYIPNGTVVPAGGYYLCTGVTYSLGNLGRNGGAAGATATGDAPIGCGGSCAANIPDDAGLVLINRAEPTLSSSEGFGIVEFGDVLYDKVGFGPYGPAAPAPAYPLSASTYCEGGAAGCLKPVGDASTGAACANPTGQFPVFPILTGAPACYGLAGQYEFLRRQITFDANQGTLHQDTNNNGNDFILVAPNPATNMGQGITGVAGVTAVLGAAGPYNSQAPPDMPAVKLTRSPLDGTNQLGPRNMERRYIPDLSIANPANNSLGTLTLRFRYTNNSGGPISGLRFEVDDLSTLCGVQSGTPASSTVGTGNARNAGSTPGCGTGSFTAILKALNSTAEVVVDSGGTAQFVNGTVMEDLSVGAAPGAGPLFSNGGGLDSKFVINPSSANASVGDGVTGGIGNFATTIGTTGPTKVIRVQIKFGVVKSGRFVLLLVPMATTAQ